MEKTVDEWDYCQITYKTDVNMGGGDQAGLNLGLLWFEARAYGPNGRYEAGKSPETLFNRLSDGFPDKSNSIHVGLHRQLVDDLVNKGWQPLSSPGGNWWQQRFRRKPRAAASYLVKRVLDLFSHGGK